MRNFLPLMILLLFSCSQIEEKEGKQNGLMNWEQELLGFGSLKIEGENFVHLFYHFGSVSEDFSIKGDTLLLSRSQLRSYLNYYSSIPGSKDSLIRRPILWSLSNPSYEYELKKKEGVIYLTNLNTCSDAPSRISLNVYAPFISNDLYLIHLENQKERDNVFHWDGSKGLYLYYEKSYIEKDDIESFRKLYIEKKTLNKNDEKILFSYLNLFTAHRSHPFKEIESGCGLGDYENLITVAYKDSLYEYGMQAFPLPISKLIHGLTLELDKKGERLEPILDTNDFLIIDRYKDLPLARKRTEREKRNLEVEKELKALDDLKSNPK